MDRHLHHLTRKGLMWLLSSDGEFEWGIFFLGEGMMSVVFYDIIYIYIIYIYIYIARES